MLIIGIIIIILQLAILSYLKALVKAPSTVAAPNEDILNWMAAIDDRLTLVHGSIINVREHVQNN